jgi:cob(I)alamin adenosyltransferase
MGGYLAGDASQKQKNDFKKKTLIMEKHIDKISAKLPSLRFFILPGGSLASSNLHYARTVCRRCERLFVDYLNDTNWMEKEADILAFVNRLSDFLYVLARKENFEQGVDDVIWKSIK